MERNRRSLAAHVLMWTDEHNLESPSSAFADGPRNFQDSWDVVRLQEERDPSIYTKKAPGGLQISPRLRQQQSLFPMKRRHLMSKFFLAPLNSVKASSESSCRIVLLLIRTATKHCYNKIVTRRVIEVPHRDEISIQRMAINATATSFQHIYNLCSSVFFIPYEHT